MKEGSHKAKKRKKSVPTTGKSSRLNISELCTGVTTADELENSEESDESKLMEVETRSSGRVSLHAQNFSEKFGVVRQTAKFSNQEKYGDRNSAGMGQC